MMRMLAIPAALAAGPAAALTPMLPPCVFEGIEVEGHEISWTQQQANNFVSYNTYLPDGAERTYLEHCPSGMTLRFTSKAGELAPNDLGSGSRLREKFDEIMVSEKSYSMNEVVRLMRENGATSKRYRSNRESCACWTYYPEARGSKAPFEVAQ